MKAEMSRLNNRKLNILSCHLTLSSFLFHKWENSKNYRAIPSSSSFSSSATIQRNETNIFTFLIVYYRFHNSIERFSMKCRK